MPSCRLSDEVFKFGARAYETGVLMREKKGWRGREGGRESERESVREGEGEGGASCMYCCP
jgi:hypothetical protein